MTTLIETTLPDGQSTFVETYDVLPSVEPRVIIYFCRDPKIRAAVERFVTKELKLDLAECIMMSEFGGVFHATEQFRLASEFDHFENQLRFALDNFPTINTVIGINHDGCGRYAAAQKKWGHMFVGPSSSIERRQECDLATFTETVFRVIAPKHILVKRFFMRFANEERTKVSFEELYL